MSCTKMQFVLYTDKCDNSVFGMFRYLLIECEDQETAVKQDSKVREMYLTVMKTFSQVCHIFITKKLGVSFQGIGFWSSVELADNQNVYNICCFITT
jgi:hypothetical protein